MEYVRCFLVRDSRQGYRIQEEYYDGHEYRIPKPTGVVRESSMDIYMPLRDGGSAREGKRRLLQAYVEHLHGEIGRLEKIASAVTLDILGLDSQQAKPGPKRVKKVTARRRTTV